MHKPYITRDELITITEMSLDELEMESDSISPALADDYRKIAHTMQAVLLGGWWDKDSVCGCLVGSMHRTTYETEGTKAYHQLSSGEQRLGSIFDEYLGSVLANRYHQDDIDEYSVIRVIDEPA